MKPRIRYNSKGCWFECKGPVKSYWGYFFINGFGSTPEKAFYHWKKRAALFDDNDPNGQAMFLREPAAVQSETATNALHQHQPAPAPKGWKTKVSEVLKRLVHNHPSR